MNHRTALALLFAAQLFTNAAPLHAQVFSSQSQQSLDDGDAMRLHSEFVRSYLLPVVGHPYTADEVTETRRTLADGNRIESVKRLAKMRDRDGRQRYALSPILEREHTVIIDPVANTAWLIRPERKDVLRLRTITASRTSPLARTTAPTWSKEVSTSLGIKQIEGVDAVGVLTETTRRAGAYGSERDMQETREVWRNNEKSLTLLLRSSSPRMGERLTRLENLRLDEVPASAFALPAEYVVRDVSLPKMAATTSVPAE